MKRYLIPVFLALFVLSPLFPCCFADFPGSFDMSEEEFENSLFEQTGWEKECIDSFIWEGSDGKQYMRRCTGYQAEAFSDSVNALVKELQDRGYSLDLSEGVSLFSSLPRTDMVSTALSELGKPRSIESPPGSGCVFYNDWYCNDGSVSSSKPWSAVFISWCADSCGLIQSGTFPKTDSCSVLFSHLTSVCGFSADRVSDCFSQDSVSNVSEGDIFFFTRNGTAAAGIVTSVSGSSFQVILGDYGDRVGVLNCNAGSIESLGISDGQAVHVKYPSFSFPDALISTGTVQDTCFLFLTRELGLSKAAACGVMGNFQAECGWNITATGDGGTSFGLCQWHNERWAALRNFCSLRGLDSCSLEGQLGYLAYELTSTSESAVLYRLENIPETSAGCASAALIWAADFERCTPDSYAVRQSYAAGFYESYGF